MEGKACSKCSTFGEVSGDEHAEPCPDCRNGFEKAAPRLRMVISPEAAFDKAAGAAESFLSEFGGIMGGAYKGDVPATVDVALERGVDQAVGLTVNILRRDEFAAAASRKVREELKNYLAHVFNPYTRSRDPKIADTAMEIFNRIFPEHDKLAQLARLRELFIPNDLPEVKR